MHERHTYPNLAQIRFAKSRWSLAKSRWSLALSCRIAQGHGIECKTRRGFFPAGL
jgi:hypothetical protein